jgi:DNA-directed RNA polymerase specialized sigma24 family protein
LPPLDEATARRLQERHLLRLAISQLAPPCQALLRLCFAERPRPSAAEAALALHLSAENLDAAQARCLQRLHHALSRLGYLWPASVPAPEPARSEDATTL